MTAMAGRGGCLCRLLVRGFGGEAILRSEPVSGVFGREHRQLSSRVAGSSSVRVDESPRPRDDGKGEKKGKAKRLDPWQKKDSLIGELARTRERLTPEEFRLEKSNFQNLANFESQLMNWCASIRNLSLGRSLVECMRATSTAPSLVALSKYLRLLGDCKLIDRADVEEGELLDLYSKVVGDRLAVLDAGTTEDVIHGLCATSRWREVVALVEHIGVVGDKVACATLQHVAAAAFRHADFDLGRSFMERAAAGRSKNSLDLGFKEWMKACQQRAEVSERRRDMDEMLGFVRKHQIFVSANVVNCMKETFERNLEEGWMGRSTSVSTRGLCCACNSRLEGIRLSQEEFAQLRDNFLNRVVEGKDVFLKTCPEELERFKEFLQTTAPYTLVLDGLNVAYASQSKSGNHAKQLLIVVQHFVRSERNCKILVLGRRHMLNWPKKYLNAIKQEAALFAVDDLSKDDPYLLYAAMFSGQGTMLLSKDMMRDHLFSLHDPTLESYFRRWLRGHHMEIMYVKGNGEVMLKPALVHNPVAQFCAPHWHIPYDDGLPRLANQVPNSWMCLRKMESKR